MLTEGLSFNENGHLFIENCDTTELANNYGTPLYVMNEALIRNNCRRYKSFFKNNFSAESYPCYASKAFCCLEIYRIMKEEGMGVDVVSGGELYTALNAGFPAEKIFFHGNNKTEQELRMAIKYGVGRIIVDNFTELELVDNLAREVNKCVCIGLRIKPGIEAHTHEYIRTGQIDSKFGFALENGEAFEAVKKAIELNNVNLSQLHCHIGSQIFDTVPFTDAVKIMLEFIASIKCNLDFEINELNLGGGLGAKYTDSDMPLEIEEYLTPICETFHSTCERLNLREPEFHIEPGRSIVGEAGTTLYKIGAVKNIPNIRTFVSVDGGMSDNIRYALYKSEYTIINASKSTGSVVENVTVAGKCCESGDLLQENIKLTDPQPGDILAVLTTGAYNYSMASNYNRILRPAIVMVAKGRSRVVVQRESYADLLNNDI